MQQLHLVGFTTDLEGLIFSARRGAKSGGFTIALDEHLLAVLEEALRLRTERDDEDDGDVADPRTPGHPSRGTTARRAPRPESHLTPREIQARLRAGRTIEEIASEAAVDEEWIARFAAPILAEQGQVVGRARDLVFSKARVGASTQPLGTSVLWNLVDKGIALTEAEYEGAWSAYHLRDTSWIVRFEYVSRRRSQIAEWEVDLREAELWSLNRLATELGYVEPGRRKRRVSFAEPPPEAPAANESRATTERAAAPRRAGGGRPPARPQLPAPKPARAAAKRAAATKAAARKAAATKVAAKKVAAKKAAAKKAAAKKVATKKVATKKVAPRNVAAKRKAAPGNRLAARKKTAPRKVAAKKSPARGAAARSRTQPARRGAATSTARGSTRTTAGRPTTRRPPAKATARAPLVRAPAPVPARPIAVPAVPRGGPARPAAVVPIAAQPPAPPGGRRPPPARPARVLDPPAPAADLVTASDVERPPARESAVRIIPGPARPEPSPAGADAGATSAVVRIDTRSPAVVASADRRTTSGEDGNGSGRRRVRRERPMLAPDPSPQPRQDPAATNGGPPVRIRADRAAEGPASDVVRRQETSDAGEDSRRRGGRRRRPLRAR